MNMTQAIESLGLSETVHSEIDFVQLVEQGLPVGTLEQLKLLGELSEQELGVVIPRRTLSHIRKAERLSPEQSDRVARVAAVFGLAHRTLQDRAKGNDWMRRPNRALDAHTPLSMLRTAAGAKLVEQILGRIAFGVYS